MVDIGAVSRERARRREIRGLLIRKTAQDIGIEPLALERILADTYQSRHPATDMGYRGRPCHSNDSDSRYRYSP